MKAAAVEVGPGEVEEVVDQMADPGREEEVGVVRVTTMTILVEVPAVVQDVVVVVVEEQEGDEEVRHPHHPHHPPGQPPPQTTYWTRTFSLVGSFFALCLKVSDLVTHRRRSPATAASQTS